MMKGTQAFWIIKATAPLQTMQAAQVHNVVVKNIFPEEGRHKDIFSSAYGTMHCV